MSEDSLPSTESTRCDASDCEESARDSLNSLLEKSIDSDGRCTDDCLASQCAVSCEDPKKTRKAVCCSSVGQCVWGTLLLLFSVGGLIVPPQDVMLWEKLNMRPGFPPYEWWADPPDEVRLRAYVFNVTNHERFLQGLDTKLNVQELGPVVYLEKLLHSNIRFNENSTLSYTAKRTTIYLPDENTLDLNATIIVPNLALLMEVGIPRSCVSCLIGKSVLHRFPRQGDVLLHHYSLLTALCADRCKSAAGAEYDLLLTFTDDFSRKTFGYLMKHKSEGLSSYLSNAPFFVRTGFRLIATSHGSEFFMRKTIYEYLWEYREPILDTSRSLVPGLVPVNNMGMLARIYADFTDDLTVTIGPQWGHGKFFKIDRFRGQPQLPGYDPDQCPDRIFGSTEGVMYHHRLSKQDVLLYWRKTVCKLMPLYFDAELTVDNVPAYRYNLSESVFERVTNGTDCYAMDPPLPPGVSDASKCYFDYPMVVSFPHFYTGGPTKDQFVTGLQPDRYKHNSYAVVEPITGTPFRSVARMQSNLLIRDLSGFSKEYDKLSNLIIPLFWAEYNQEGLPKRIKNTIYFMVVVLPPLSNILLSVTLLSACFILFRQIYIKKFKNDSLNSVLQLQYNQNKALASSKWFTPDKDAFLNMPS